MIMTLLKPLVDNGSERHPKIKQRYHHALAWKKVDRKIILGNTRAFLSNNRQRSSMMCLTRIWALTRVTKRWVQGPTLKIHPIIIPKPTTETSLPRRTIFYLVRRKLTFCEFCMKFYNVTKMSNLRRSICLCEKISIWSMHSECWTLMRAVLWLPKNCTLPWIDSKFASRKKIVICSFCGTTEMWTAILSIASSLTLSRPLISTTLATWAQKDSNIVLSLPFRPSRMTRSETFATCGTWWSELNKLLNK